jgi:hypothetical protein
MAHSFFLTVCIPIPIPVDELIIVRASCCPCHASSSQTPDFRPKKGSKTVLIALKHKNGGRHHPNHLLVGIPPSSTFLVRALNPIQQKVTFWSTESEFSHALTTQLYIFTIVKTSDATPLGSAWPAHPWCSAPKAGYWSPHIRIGKIPPCSTAKKI